ncbi:hypothetical protein [Mesorhizobium sp. B2-8-9]|uniref:hypothetical protein n=1 Tax=Mesorhizobium sp. B2-8-9 TaxID=2589899 RepID=UPI001128B386|nr:hypothetical protein [Mesorhizobium sp. B2-8-9]TPI80436.1 hypothetical protein FJ423_12135 [Mesorhizobium sp. B2-8-9]
MDQKRILSYFGRHLVALCVATRYRDEPARFNAYSGTLMRVDGTVLWLTAGHIIRELEEALDSPDVTFDETVLADAFGEAFLSEKPVPIDLRSSWRMFRDDDSLGLDFGAIVIHPHHERLLLANNVRVLEEANWNRQHTVNFMGYVMLGLPEEFTSAKLPENGLATLSPTMFPVQRLAEVPAGHGKEYPRLTARIHERIPLKSAKGMSGGPKFGFAETAEGLAHWVVALQSSWLEKSRTVFACPLPVFAPMLTEWVRSLPAKAA